MFETFSRKVMILTVIITSLLSIILLSIFHRPFRFYLYSFFLPWLFDHPQISYYLGIRYEDDTIWRTDRTVSRVYIPGFIAQLLRIFIGMDFVLPDNVRKSFEYLQSKHGNEINMGQYFEQLDNKTINVIEFEDFLSRNVIIETNRVFKIIDQDQCDWLVVHSKALRTIVSALTISMWDGIKTAFFNFHHVIRMSLLLRSAPEHTRILLIAPQLALIHNFVKMIINKRGDMSDVQPYDFLEPVSRFFVATTVRPDGTVDLVFVKRQFDKKNNVNNRAFGPYGLQCPGALYTFKFIRDVTKFLKALTITVSGEPKYEGRRFSNMTNKEEILLTFRKNDGWESAENEVKDTVEPVEIDVDN